MARLDPMLVTREIHLVDLCSKSLEFCTGIQSIRHEHFHRLIDMLVKGPRVSTTQPTRWTTSTQR